MATNSKYEIYWRKEQDGTPNQATSPTGSQATSPKDSGMTVRKAAIYGVGIAVAKRGFDTLRSELVATTGNEALQTNINNAMKAVGYTTAIAVGGIAGAVYVGTDVVSQAITNSRELKRRNRVIQLDNKLRGKRVNMAGGVNYYG